MATFQIVNFGCRATQADAAAIERQLLESGLAPAIEQSAADIVVINTCTVTAAADLQARQAIAEFARRNPAARILATGCYAQRAPEDLAQLPGVAWVVGNSHRHEIARLIVNNGCSSSPGAIVPIEHLLQPRRAEIVTGDISGVREVAAEELFVRGLGHTRPTLKIQDGCNNRCGYCVIPSVRGKSRSLAPANILELISRAVDRGAQEIVLSGINLGSYGRDLTPRIEFVELLRRIVNETSLARLRVSSIEPMDVTRDLIELVASSNRIARHFHIPLQSGSDPVLASMHRWYRAAHYAEHVNLIREMLPDAAIGADVVAGYPGETDAHHRATVEFIERLPLSYLHVFSFSPRPGTEGATLPNQVDARTIRARARELRALGDAKKRAFRASQIGKRMRVLTLVSRAKREVSTSCESWTRAVSGNYLDLRVAGTWPANRWLDVEIVALRGGEIFAHPIRDAAAAHSTFEDHLRECGVGAVRDAERNADHAETSGEFFRASV